MLKNLLSFLKSRYYAWKMEMELGRSFGTSNNRIDSIGLSSSTDTSTDIEQIQDDTQQKYHEAILRIKKSVNKEVSALGNDKDNYHKVLSEYTSDTDEWTKDLSKKDLMRFANEEESETIRAYKNTKYRKGADVRSEEDKSKMIEERIDHYKVLQVKRQIRELNKQLRKAERSGDKETAAELWEQINEHQRNIRA